MAGANKAPVPKAIVSKGVQKYSLGAVGLGASRQCWHRVDSIQHGHAAVLAGQPVLVWSNWTRDGDHSLCNQHVEGYDAPH